MTPRIAIQTEDFHVGAELSRLNLPGAGAISSFIGTVRDGGGLAALHLEHYPGMTDRALMNIAEEAATRFALLGCTIIHRTGTLRPGAQIVLAAAASAHRAAALNATAFLIDWLKTSAPFWKREEFTSGESAWVEARPEDEAAASGWGR
jgi:molybdopterin synthase catalytic subunit